MNNLMLPRDNPEAGLARRAAERIAALDAATQLGSTTTEALLSDADIILTWIRGDVPVMIHPTPPEPQNSAQERRTGSQGTQGPPHT